MKVVSVNLGKKKEVQWQGQTVVTGIFKQPVKDPIVLGNTDVEGDAVVDRRYHGGVDKACYLYSADHYPAWKKEYPNLDWNYGMFGENITISELDESKVMIGDQYEIGSAIVEVSQPRQPCFKLGIRFNTQKVLKDFIANEKPGVYLRILKSGSVKLGDEFQLINRTETISIVDVFRLLYGKAKDLKLLEVAIGSPHLPDNLKVGMMKYRPK